MARGSIFDVRDFCVHDGPGIRTTVFFKGCPLRCAWCHNPEGISFDPELMVRTSGCLDCGLCRRGCDHEECKSLGRCIHICPGGLVGRAGEVVEAEVLARRLLGLGSMLDAVGGGYTMSGGEPLAQPDFLFDLLARLAPHHRVIETSGHARGEVFARAVDLADLVLMDLKHMDPSEHARGTGVDNRRILENLDALVASGRSFVVRVPLIPGYNDSSENLEATADRLAPARHRVRVELLPLNPLAGAKYPMVGRAYRPFFDPNLNPRRDLAAFDSRGITAAVL